VPMSNLGENSGILWIRLGKLQFAKFYKSCSNLKKMGYPNYLVG